MRIQSSRLVLFALVLSCANPSAFAQQKAKIPRNQVRQASDQLVKIEVKMVPTRLMHRQSSWVKWMFTEKVTKIGNGYYIGPNRVITNFHVINSTLPKDLRWIVGIDEEDPLTVVDIKVKYHKAEIIKLDPANDLAELRVEARNPKSLLPMSNSQPEKGVAVYTINKDLEGKRELAMGEVIGPYTLAVFKDGAYEPTEVNPTHRLPPNMIEAPVLGLKLKLNVVRGWSGCWVFDYDGKFLGIVRAAHSPSNLTLLIPAQAVTDFVQSKTAATKDAGSSTVVETASTHP
jgi:S1-C subfamily serine protease